MKILLSILGFLIVASFFGLLLPAFIGILSGLVMIDAGSVLGGMLAIAAGIGINFVMIYGTFQIKDSHDSADDDTCPYCGSCDADGSHCNDCDQDY